MEASNPLDTEFKTGYKMLSELRRKIDDLSENFNKERKQKKGDRNNQSEMKNT